MLFLCSLITQRDYNCNFLEFFRRKRAHSSKCPCCYSSDEGEENNATTKKEVGWFAFSTDISARSVGNRGAFAVALTADEWVECPKLGNNNLQWLFVVENLLRRPCGIWQALRKRNRIERLCRALSRCRGFLQRSSSGFQLNKEYYVLKERLRMLVITIFVGSWNG